MSKTVPLVCGSCGSTCISGKKCCAQKKPLYGLCLEFAPKRVRWQLEGNNNFYNSLISKMQNETNEQKRTQMLQELLWIHMFNSETVGNSFDASNFLHDRDNRKHLYKAYYRNQNCFFQNGKPSEVSESAFKQKQSTEDWLIQRIHGKRLFDKSVLKLGKLWKELK